MFAKVIAERDAALAERDQAIAERDEAIAERDYMLNFLQDLGEAFTSRRLRFVPTAQGVEIRSLYPSFAAAYAVARHIRNLRAMVSLTDAATPMRHAAVAVCEAIAAAERRA